jgi:uncharacterized protein (TIGR03086 family)
VSGEHYCSEIASDIFIHSWDVARAIGADATLEPELTEFVYEFMLPRAAEMRASGLFGSKVKVPSNANVATKLLALYGRKV